MFKLDLLKANYPNEKCSEPFPGLVDLINFT